MKTWKLVSGILSMILFVIVGVVSAFSLRLTSNKQVGE